MYIVHRTLIIFLSFEMGRKQIEKFILKYLASGKYGSTFKYSFR